MKRSHNRRLFYLLVIFIAVAGSLSAQPLPGEHPVRLYQEGVRYRAEGDYYRAIEYFRLALAKNPAYLDAVLASAEIYFILEEYDQALSLADRAISLSPGNSSAGVLRGRILVGLGELPEAAKAFQAILTSEPNNVEARLAGAELEIAQGKNRSAAREYLETLQAAPNNRRALLSLALLYDNMGNSGTAREYFDLAVRFHGDVPVTHFLAGEFYLRGGRTDAAENHAAIALSLNPDYEDALMLLGGVHLKRKNFGSVYSTMDTVLRLNRENISAWYLKGLAALRMGRSKEAVDLLRTLLTLKPEDEVARITLEDTLRESLPVEDPMRRNFGVYHFERGDRFRERNLFSRAQEEYRRGLQIDPYSKRGRLAFADILEKLGFPARSLGVLQFLKDQNLSDPSVEERMEIAASLLEDRVSRIWNVDQTLVKKRRFALSVFFDSETSHLAHADSGLYLARYFGDLLIGTPRFSLVSEPAAVGNYAEAFQEARQRSGDYFLILSFSESDREFILKADLHLSRTGGKIDSIQVYRTGNDRVQNSLVRLVSDLAERFPLRGDLLRREFERGLVNLGSLDGIKDGDSLLIVPEKSLSLKHDTIEFVHKPDDILGTITIVRTDDMVSEGIIEKQGFFDRINPGDAVIPGKMPEKKTETLPGSVPNMPLYKKILRIQ